MPTLDDLKWVKFPVLDKGYVALVDAMGTDADIVDAARTSFGKGTKSVSDDRKLLRLLMRRDHATPFEMAEIKLALRIPNGDTWRQMIRHRAASIRDEASMWDEPSVNSYSFRYSEAEEFFQQTDPDAWRAQSTSNKQGSGPGEIRWPEGYTEFNPGREEPGQYLSDREWTVIETAKNVYQERLKFGVAREQARKDLPNSLYVTAYWKCDLRNVLHMLLLRSTIPYLAEHQQHAQKEIRAYCDTIGEKIIAPLFPLTWEAFGDYRLRAMSLSALDIEVARHVVAGCDVEKALRDLVDDRRERDECREKLARLGMVKGD